ncbi:LemA family protein [Parachlamydia sp. AcF125]|uniref:LemA family protein n=1 Tax=Parachlamydia sp. AcF125 TaxID=2795736 RepID=UPI001BC901CC|nr:LemA family protein [Parachlamydia sp. AcF125]MBS4168470.1 Protein LemA [Parachlamydia sp. AcF125]
MGTPLLIILAILALLALSGIGIYNRLVALQNQVKNAWSQIDVQLQRRYDLIPNLVESVKGYMNYEKGTLESVIQARNTASAAREAVEKGGGPTGSGSIKQLLGAETALKGALGHFFALAENYPQLRASENMQQLQEELSSTENKVAFARQAYNDQVMLYNITQQTFPAALFATLFGHHPAELFEIQDTEAKKAVKVSF